MAETDSILSPQSGMAADLSTLSYEQAMALLERIVQRLESGEISLDESMKLYQQGIELARSCESQLAAVEHQITQLLVRPDGSLEEKPFGGPADS